MNCYSWLDIWHKYLHAQISLHLIDGLKGRKAMICYNLSNSIAGEKWHWCICCWAEDNGYSLVISWNPNTYLMQMRQTGMTLQTQMGHQGAGYCSSHLFIKKCLEDRALWFDRDFFFFTKEDKSQRKIAEEKKLEEIPKFYKTLVEILLALSFHKLVHMIQDCWHRTLYPA